MEMEAFKITHVVWHLELGLTERLKNSPALRRTLRAILDHVDS
jgi:hypothetical protein